jgi:cytochrome c peroxidase
MLDKLIIGLVFFYSVAADANLRLENSPIKPIEIPVFSVEKAAIGEKLFNDKRLSANESISCHDCHDMKKGGADGFSKSKGAIGKLTGRNSPTVINSAVYRLLMWDGRLDKGEGKTLKTQAEAVLKNKLVMGWDDLSQIEKRVNSIPEYANYINRIYSASFVTIEHISDLLSEFQTSLTAIDSPFDLWLAGDGEISAEAEKGFFLFQRYQCVNCHWGSAVGAASQQRLGVYDDPSGKYSQLRLDTGLEKTTKKSEDLFKFRVPSLRLASCTAPYFHDGSVKTLDESIKLMGQIQRNEEIPAKERLYIAEFIRSLAGKINGKPICL